MTKTAASNRHTLDTYPLWRHWTWHFCKLKRSENRTLFCSKLAKNNSFRTNYTKYVYQNRMILGRQTAPKYLLHNIRR